MKDRDGNTPEPGWVYFWPQNGGKYEIKKASHGLYYWDLQTDRPAYLKPQTRTLAQMERVR